MCVSSTRPPSSYRRAYIPTRSGFSRQRNNKRPPNRPYSFFRPALVCPAENGFPLSNSIHPLNALASHFVLFITRFSFVVEGPPVFRVSPDPSKIGRRRVYPLVKNIYIFIRESEYTAVDAPNSGYARRGFLNGVKNNNSTTVGLMSRYTRRFYPAVTAHTAR